MRPTPLPSSSHATVGAGFSLIELLVVIAITAILAAMLISSIKLVRMQASKTVCMSNLRNIGLAISGYTNDWEGILPGPTGYGQMYDYKTGDVRLTMHLWSYLDGPEPTGVRQVLKPFACNETFRRKSGLSYMGFNGDPTLGAPGAQKRWSPFGVYVGAGSIWNRDPWPLNEAKNISTLWALKEVDRLNVNSATGWWSGLPVGPVHGAARNVLYFDFRAESVLASTDTVVY